MNFIHLVKLYIGKERCIVTITTTSLQLGKVAESFISKVRQLGYKVEVSSEEETIVSMSEYYPPSVGVISTMLGYKPFCTYLEEGKLKVAWKKSSWGAKLQELKEREKKSEISNLQPLM